jgi:hypothetical protein
MEEKNSCSPWERVDSLLAKMIAEGNQNFAINASPPTIEAQPKILTGLAR